MARSEGAPVSVRLSVVGGDGVKREFDAFSRAGQKALKDLESAAHGVSPALRVVDATVREVGTSVESLAHHAGPVGRILAEIGPAGIAAGVGIGAAVLATHKAIEIAKEAVESFDKLHNTIENLGINSDLFQGLQFGAQLKGIGADQFADAIKSAQLRFGELEIGVGRATKQLTIYDSELAHNLKMASSFEDRLKLVSDAMEKETDSTKRNVLAKIIFGEANTHMAQVLGQGADAIDHMIEEAKSAGVVIDRSLLEKGHELKEQMDAVSTAIDINLKQAFIELAPWMLKASELALKIAQGINDIVDSTRALEDRTRRGPLMDELTDVLKRKQEAEAELKRLNSAANPGFTEGIVPGLGGDDRDALRGQIADLTDRRNALLAQLKKLNTPETVSPAAAADANADQLQSMTEAVNRMLEGVASKAEKVSKVRADIDEMVAQLEVLRGKPGADTAAIDKTIADAREAEKRQIAQIMASEIKHAASLQHQDEEELKRLSERYSATQKYSDLLQRLDDAKAKGFLSDQEYASARLRAQEELNNALEKQREKELEATNTFGSGVQLGLMKVADNAKDVAGQVSEAIEHAFDGATDSLVDFVMTGKGNFKDLADSIIRDLLRIAIQSAVMGPLAKIVGAGFGSLTGGAAPAFAGGGGGPPLNLLPSGPSPLPSASPAFGGGFGHGKVEVHVHNDGTQVSEVREKTGANGVQELHAYVRAVARAEAASMFPQPTIRR